MAQKTLVLALSMIAAASPLSAASEDRMTAAPSGSIDTRYCMRVDAFTGSLVEQVKCWTRDQWSDQGVDVDRDWPENGVRTIG